MKKTILFSAFICLSLALTSQVKQSETSFKWTKALRKEYLKNRQDSTKWDLEMLNTDKPINGLDMAGPFELAAWPVPKYKIIAGDDNVGNGNRPAKFSYKDKFIYMNSFIAGKTKVNENYLQEKDNEVYFHIIVLSDIPNPEVNSIVMSRNYPDFFGQGFVKTSKKNIEYAAFITAEREAFAIINTRLFNLNFGKTILIAPQPDGTLRSLQIDSPKLYDETIVDYTCELFKKEEITNFFNLKKTN